MKKILEALLKVPRESQMQSAASLAVLPFVNMSSDNENEFLSDGITEDLIMALSRVKGLRVPARTSSFEFKGKNEDIRRIGQLLSVETLLEGSVRKSGSKLRVTAKLVKVRDGFHLWSERYDREMKDVFDIQDDITRAIVGALEIQMGGGAETHFVPRQTASTEAYELYMKGRFFLNQRGRGLEKALHYFELALLEDPNYGLALAGLADSLSTLTNFDLRHVKEVMPRAEAAAERAVHLAPSLAETHASLGFVKAMFRWNWPAAEQCYVRALELNPKYAQAYGFYSLLLELLGRGDEAVAASQRAVELDPLSPERAGAAGWPFVFARQFAPGAEFSRRTVERWPQSATAYLPLSECLVALGQYQEAVTAAQEGVSQEGGSPMALCRLGFALAKAGEFKQACRVLSEMQRPSEPWVVHFGYNAMVQFALGEKSAGLESLRRSFDEHELVLPWILVWPFHDELRGDPDFSELRRKVGLSE